MKRISQAPFSSTHHVNLVTWDWGGEYESHMIHSFEDIWNTWFSLHWSQCTTSQQIIHPTSIPQLQKLQNPGSLFDSVTKFTWWGCALGKTLGPSCLLFTWQPTAKLNSTSTKPTSNISKLHYPRIKNVIQPKDVDRATAAKSGKEEGGRLRCLHALGKKLRPGSPTQMLILAAR